jgi:hypothetical protein
MTRDAMRLCEPQGRIEFEHELFELKREVKKRDIVANQLLDALLKKHGLANNLLKQQADEYWAYHNPSEPEDPSLRAHPVIDAGTAPSSTPRRRAAALLAGSQRRSAAVSSPQRVECSSRKARVSRVVKCW